MIWRLSTSFQVNTFVTDGNDVIPSKTAKAYADTPEIKKNIQ